MLVYARAEPTPHASPEPGSSTTSAKKPSPSADTHIPPRALEVVNSMNAEFDQACDEYTQRCIPSFQCVAWTSTFAHVDPREKDSKERFEETRRLVMDIYQTWRLSSREEVCIPASLRTVCKDADVAQDSAVVSRQALDACLSRYLVKPPKPSSDKDESRAPLVAVSEGMYSFYISYALYSQLHRQDDVHDF